jgi:DNA invertase Pin-like site-specific DNA recombinase
VYIRISTEEQASGAAVQRAQVQASCQARGWEAIRPSFEDLGVSGGLPIAKRPALTRLIEAARAGAFQHAVAQALDRWSRDLYEFLALYKELGKVGVQLHSVREPAGEGAAGQFSRQVIGAAAEFERALIGQRIAAYPLFCPGHDSGATC